MELVSTQEVMCSQHVKKGIYLDHSDKNDPAATIFPHGKCSLWIHTNTMVGCVLKGRKQA